MTVDSDQDRLMVAFNTVPACLWVGGDPDWSLYAISEGLAVMTGEARSMATTRTWSCRC